MGRVSPHIRRTTLSPFRFRRSKQRARTRLSLGNVDSRSRDGIAVCGGVRKEATSWSAVRTPRSRSVSRCGAKARPHWLGVPDAVAPCVGRAVVFCAVKRNATSKVAVSRLRLISLAWACSSSGGWYIHYLPWWPCYHCRLVVGECSDGGRSVCVVEAGHAGQRIIWAVDVWWLYRGKLD